MKKKVLILVNHEIVIYNFRLELVERLLEEGYEVHISSSYGEKIDELVSLGAYFHDIMMDRRGMNPIKEVKLLNTYKRLIGEVRPDVVLGYTVKPNIYGAIAANKLGIPFIANITGLGTAVENARLSKMIVLSLYHIAFKNVKKVFFQNTANQEFFINHNIAVDRQELLPGSGVNLVRFPVKPYPDGEVIRFAFISRIMKEKGVDQYLDAAKYIKNKYPNTEFHVCGYCDVECKDRLQEYCDNGVVSYHGMVRDVSEFLEDINCVVHPTYYPEGLSNILLEGAATGRPLITTDRPGCREVIEDGVNGFVVPQKDSKSLMAAIEKFLNLSNDVQKKMGLAAREKVVKEFDRQIVVEAYMREIKKYA